jgi:choline dehydrogenase
MAVAADFVVVGAGSAGCVLAARLSEDPSARVVLLEAGGADTMREARIPAAFHKLFRTAADWQYETQPQPRLGNRRLYWPRGKLLGGCSSMNAMIWIRGHPGDYDDWAAHGSVGWRYSEVRKYFDRAAVSVEPLRYVNRLSRAFLSACRQIGIPENPDFNGAQQEGAGLFRVCQRRGLRSSTATAYLRPAAGRGNLSVVTAAQATRVLFEGTRAIGVEYVRDGHLERVDAGEVVVAAGTVNSPHLLMVSGVGPAEHLAGLGLGVVADLPGVGQNLQDHLAATVSYACRHPVTLDHAETLANFARFLVLRRGPFTSSVAEAGAFLHTKPDLAAPDLQLLFAPVSDIDHGLVRPAGHGFTIVACLLRPASRGAIRLASADPLAAPLIDPGYLADEIDLARLVQGVEMARRVGDAPAFDAYRGAEKLPGATVRREQALAAYIRDRAQTLYHPVGTCRMGTDPLSVVSPTLTVHGTQRLRVVDASIMPTIVGGNTNAPTIMIAEKGADLIRASKGASTAPSEPPPRIR